LMTLVGIADTPVFGAGFLICAEKGFMVQSWLMRQQRAEARCWLVSLATMAYSRFHCYLS
jgi:hypothetical protein